MQKKLLKIILLCLLLNNNKAFPYDYHITNATQKKIKAIVWIEQSGKKPYYEVEIAPMKTKVVKTGGWCNDGISIGPVNMNVMQSIDEVINTYGLTAGAAAIGLGSIIGVLSKTAVSSLQPQELKPLIQELKKIKKNIQNNIAKLNKQPSLNRNIIYLEKKKLKTVDYTLDFAQKGNLSSLHRSLKSPRLQKLFPKNLHGAQQIIKEHQTSIARNLKKINALKTGTSGKNISTQARQLSIEQLQRESDHLKEVIKRIEIEDIPRYQKEVLASKTKLTKSLKVGVAVLFIAGAAVLIALAASNNNKWYVPIHYYHNTWGMNCAGNHFVWTGNKLQDKLSQKLTEQQIQQEGKKGLTWGKYQFELLNTSKYTINASFGFTGDGAQHKRVLPGHKFVVRSDKGLKNISINQNGQFTDKQLGNIQQSTSITWTNEGFGQLGVQSGIRKRNAQQRRRF